MTERNSNEAGAHQERDASHDEEGQTRRTFLGAAAAATGGLLAAGVGDAGADGREIVDEAGAYRYADGDYGSTTVTDHAFGAFNAESWTKDCGVSVTRHSDAVALNLDMPGPFGFGIELTAEQSAALREELRYAEQQIPPEDTD